MTAVPGDPAPRRPVRNPTTRDAFTRTTSPGRISARVTRSASPASAAGCTRAAGRPARTAAVADGRAPRPDGHQVVDPQGGEPLADPRVLLGRERAELRHLAENRQPPARRRPSHSPLRALPPWRWDWRCRRRSRSSRAPPCGPPASVRPTPRRGPARPPPPPARRPAPPPRPRPRAHPGPSARRGSTGAHRLRPRASAGGTPPARSRRPPRRPRRTRRRRARGRTGAPTRAVRLSKSRTSGSSPFSTAVPSAGSASTSSPFAITMFSSDPNSSRCAGADVRHDPDARPGDLAERA